MIKLLAKVTKSYVMNHITLEFPSNIGLFGNWLSVSGKTHTGYLPIFNGLSGGLFNYLW